MFLGVTDGWSAPDMPVITGRSSYATTSGTPPATQSIPLPSGIVAGELLMMAILMSSFTVSTPAGWTSIYNQQPNTRTVIFVRTANGSEGSSINVTFSGTTNVCVFVWRVANWGGVTPTVSTIATGTSTAPNATAVAFSADTPETLVISIAHVNASVTVSAAPAGYDNLQSVVSQAPRTAAVAEKDCAGSAEDAGAFAVNASNPWTAVSIAIQGPLP